MSFIKTVSAAALLGALSLAACKSGGEAAPAPAASQPAEGAPAAGEGAPAGGETPPPAEGGAAGGSQGGN